MSVFGPGTPNTEAEFAADGIRVANDSKGGVWLIPEGLEADLRAIATAKEFIRRLEEKGAGLLPGN